MLRVIKKFSFLLDRKQKRQLTFIFVLMLIGAGMEVIGVSLMLPLVTAIMKPDIITNDKNVKMVCELLDLHSHRTFVIACIAALIIVFVVKDLFLIGEYYAQTRFVCINRLMTKKKLIKSFLNRPYEFFLNAKSGDIFQIIQTDSSQTYALLTTILNFWTEAVISVALVITIFVVDPVMTCFVAVIMGLTILVIGKVVRPVLRKHGLNFQMYSSINHKWLQQAITGVKEVKVSQKESFFEEEYVNAGRGVIRAEMVNTVLGHVPRLLIEMISVCSMLSLVAIMIYRGREIEDLIPTLGAFAMAAVKLMPSANRMVGAMNAISYQEPALDKMLENLDIIGNSKDLSAKCTEVKEGYDSSKFDLHIDKSITLSSVTYSYPNSEKKVLNDASLVIPVGKSVGIVGASGAGKTTAVDILLGLLQPQSGQVLVDEVDIRENYSAWLSKIGYIPQSIFMLDDSVKNNVAFGLRDSEVDEAQVWHALEEAQLADFVRGLPEGIDTQIGERGVRLSGGQRQRIGIARALYPNPELLLFDEATSALDNETEAAIMESINNLHGKKTMVIIAHRLQTIEGCDMVYRVAEGKIKRDR